MKKLTTKNISTKFINLSWRLAVVDFKLRNEGSYLGNLWYLLNPLLLFLILFLVFFDRLGSAIQSYPAYLIIGILMFNFFMRTTLDSTKAILESGFIKSFNFQREALVLSVVLKHLFSHLFEIVIFFIILIFLGIPFYGILFYLFVLVFLSLFIYGVSLFLSALTIYFVDLGNVWQFFITLVWFGTPIFYAIEGQDRLLVLNQFNPMYYFITATRDSVVYGTMSEPQILLGVILFPLISLTVGTLVFKKLKSKFAEMV